MPTYPYECEKHGSFEVIKPMSEASREENCPKCGKLAKRVWGCNIDQTMYKRDPSSKEYWRRNLSVQERASVLLDERDPY